MRRASVGQFRFQRGLAGQFLHTERTHGIRGYRGGDRALSVDRRRGAGDFPVRGRRGPTAAGEQEEHAGQERHVAAAPAHPVQGKAQDFVDGIHSSGVNSSKYACAPTQAWAPSLLLLTDVAGHFTFYRREDSPLHRDVGVYPQEARMSNRKTTLTCTVSVAFLIPALLSFAQAPVAERWSIISDDRDEALKPAP